jgi:L-erythro-3,5-diaminohexanoate dehydrogenase
MESRGKGQPFGVQRVIDPPHTLPQSAKKLDASLPIYQNEILIDVEMLHLDSASFHQMEREALAHFPKKPSAEQISDFIAKTVLENVQSLGKQVNRITGSGGMLVGCVQEIGADYKGPAPKPFQVGDRLATLISLTLTPLSLQKIKAVYLTGARAGQMDVQGYAIVVDGAPCVAMPGDLAETLVLSVLDVCGAPAQMDRLVKPEQTVVVLGAGGKSGLLCLHQARKKLAKTGRLLALDYSPQGIENIKKLSLADRVFQVDARNCLEVFEIIKEATNGQLADLVVNTTNISETEMACILCARSGGKVYFFNMATHFARAALGAEGIGKDVELMIGNGFTPGHAQLGLNIMRENESLRKIFLEIPT